MLRVLHKVKQKVMSGQCEYQTLCIDSLTEMGVLRHRYAEDIEKLTGFTLWGIVAKDLTNWLRELKRLPIHVYVTCQAQATKNEKTGVLKTSPVVAGNKTSLELPYLFDEVFLLERTANSEGKISSMFKTSSGEEAIAKDHSGKLEIHEPPNLTNIFNKILSIDISKLDEDDDHHNDHKELLVK